jgi:hypothetical protein
MLDAKLPQVGCVFPEPCYGLATIHATNIADFGLARTASEGP